ncbi:hypothetical protein [Pseudomonas sp. Leaf59]|uniref:hypothetical protein n=1 Tax=Pseudomonas sp. Leaf59 TaxID=2876556 RepID=UPI001E295D6B|nr:hypothetical protein [Pseudomonas sp. Leaf59]
MNQMSTISMNNVAGFKSDVNAKGDTAAQITQAMEKPVNNLGFVPKKVGEPDGAALITETRAANPLRAETKTLPATPSAFKT